MRHLRLFAAAALLAGAVALSHTGVRAHGDVTPQPVDTTGLDKLEDGKWLQENPFRGNKRAIEIGSSAYNQNCARCHGLEAISGGLSPDLRFLDKGKAGDEWFMERIRKGAVIGGVTRMPAFEGQMSQEAMWAIRAYLDTRFEG